MTILAGNRFFNRRNHGWNGIYTRRRPINEYHAWFPAWFEHAGFFGSNSATTTDNIGNPSGLIVAFTSDVIHAPEPASLGLLGAGLALIGLFSVRQRKS